MADSDFVTGMVVGGGGRAGVKWQGAAASWEKAARSHEHQSAAVSGLLFGVFDVLKTLPLETRVQILSSLQQSLAPATRGRFEKRGLTAEEADLRAAEFLRQLEAAWSKAAAVSSNPRPDNRRL